MQPPFKDFTARPDYLGAFGLLETKEGVLLVANRRLIGGVPTVAWDLPGDSDVPLRLAQRAGEGLFGTLGAVRTEQGWDVTLRYTFPAAGLDEAPLGTLLMLVVANASQLRAELS